MTSTTTSMFLAAFDYTNQRLVSRLEGLSDAEYFWEPVPGCWSLRRWSDGTYRMDPAPGQGEPAAPPLTTLAWRLCHIGGGLREFAESLETGALGRESHTCPATAVEAMVFVQDCFSRWRRAVARLQDDAIWRELGSGWGPYSTDSVADLVAHEFDEFVHHGAEVALLRDLYAAGLG